MENLTATLVYKTVRQRFYKLNKSLTIGVHPLSGRSVDIAAELAETKEKRFKPESKHLCPVGGIDIVCVSDAHTHTERLVFAGFEYPDGTCGAIVPVQIDGAHTMMIHGGDDRMVKPDQVYLRRLASLNGFYYQQFSVGGAA